MGYFHVAVDGPVGVGKSTVSRLAAQMAGFLYVDTGAMYRAVALYAVQNGADTRDEAAVNALLGDIDITLAIGGDGTQQVFLNGRDVTGDIRTTEISAGASAVGRYKAVREKLAESQRRIAENADVIMDGRDIGTRILPNARVKVYLDAHADIRAKRRLLELEAKGVLTDFETVRRETAQRDYDDKMREQSPLMIAEGAVVIDTGRMSAEEAARKVFSLIEKNGGAQLCSTQ